MGLAKGERSLWVVLTPLAQKILDGPLELRGEGDRKKWTIEQVVEWFAKLPKTQRQFILGDYEERLRPTFVREFVRWALLLIPHDQRQGLVDELKKPVMPPVDEVNGDAVPPVERPRAAKRRGEDN